MKQIVQRKLLVVPKSLIRPSNPCSIRRSIGYPSTSSSATQVPNRRRFHSTTNVRTENAEPDRKDGPLPKSADLNTSSGTWGQERSAPNPVPRGISGMGPVVLTLGLLFVTCTAWFGYRYYRATTVYPPPVRAQIRNGLRAMLDGDLEQAEVALRRAWAIAESLPPDSMGPDPLLKLSGIAIQLAECLERARKPKAAYEVYLRSLPDFFDQFAVYTPQSNKETRRHPEWSSVALSGKGRLRAVGIANRAAMLAQELQGSGIEPPVCDVSTAGQPPGWTQSWEEIEMYLRTFSVTQILYLTSNTTGIPTAALSTSPDLDNRLPSWLRRLDLAAPCESLADCYVRRGEIELALPLYQTSYYFLLSRSSLPTALNISLTGPLSTTTGPPPDPTTMCIAASILTAMSAAALGIDSPKSVLANRPSSSSTVPEPLDSSSAKASRILAVRSWARESRYLVDLGRRSAGGQAYNTSLAGIDVLGREDEEKSKTRKESQKETKTSNGDIEMVEKDKRLVRLDLERIREAGRRLGEIILEGRISAQDGRVPSPKMTVNPTCERTWAVVLYNTGIIELMDGDKPTAEEYLQLALEQSRRTNLLEGVTRSKAALMSLLSKGRKSKS